MELNKLLSRQLKRLDLKEDSPPIDLEKWQSFLKSVGNSYADADQERYMLERSMELSSQELLQVNSKLESAQEISRLGYWFYDRPNDRISLSKNLYELFNIDSLKPSLTHAELLELTFEEDRARFEKMIDKAFSERGRHEAEVRIQSSNGTYDWYRIIVSLEQRDAAAGSVLTGIAMDVTKRKKAEEEVKLLHQQLLESARLAGMADVAVSVLHNVGNVLNSANISIGMLQEGLRHSHCKKLFASIDMIKQHLPSATEYLSEDPKGKLLPQYLVALGEVVEKDYQSFSEEINNLSKYLQHVKDIVVMQKAVSNAAKIKEHCYLPEIVDTSLQISGKLFEDQNIKLIKEYEEVPVVLLDRSKLLQILINLIQNAKDAVLSSSLEGSKQIKIKSTTDQAEEKMRVIVEDNGIGIPPENLTKIFAFAFTTKKDGNGFGLHSSALDAKELGGSLHAESDGKDKGSKLILTLPLKETDKKHEDQNNHAK